MGGWRWLAVLMAVGPSTGGVASAERVHVPLSGLAAAYDYGWPGHDTRDSPPRLPLGPSWQIDRSGRPVQMATRTQGPWEPEVPRLGYGASMARVLWEIAPPVGRTLTAVGVRYRGGPFHAAVPTATVQLSLHQRSRSSEAVQGLSEIGRDAPQSVLELEQLHELRVELEHEVLEDPDARYLILITGEHGAEARSGATVYDLWYELAP